MKRTILTSLLVAASVAAVGCVSTSSVGYGDGVVTTSPVTYEYEAQPVLQQSRGTTYSVGGDAGSAAIPTFEKNGMRKTQDQGDVQVAIQLGEMQQGEPGAVKVSGGYVPAFTVTMPYTVTMQHQGQTVAQQGDKYENLLTFKNGARFPTREQAIAAIDTIRRLAEQGLEQRTREAAGKAALETADQTAGQLFRTRHMNVEVPVVRSAAGVDLEPCYTMVAEQQDFAQALAAYEQQGTDHTTEQGAPNNTASYGVLCGIAACKLLMGDLEGAWAATKQADRFEPEGQEADQLRRVIYRQEQQTGVAVIPAEDRRQIQAAEQKAHALQRLFAAPNK